MYRKFTQIIVFIIIVAISFQNNDKLFQLDDTDMFSNRIQQAAKTEDDLYKEIETKSVKYAKVPEDAKIDRVWKKIPGRNGLKVNVDKSYKQMKEEGTFDPSLLVYDQVEPSVTLNDLPAEPIYRGHPEKQMTALLINVSWGKEYIPTILNELKENNVKATFFIEGKWAKEHSDFVKMIDEQGHTIGNHAYNHPDMAHLSKKEAAKQIQQTNEIIEAITGEKPKWFAPPSGSYNDQVVSAADKMDMQTILWTVDTIDWKNPTVSVMVNRVKKKVHPGATVLMHPTSSVAQGMDLMIRAIKEEGYQIGTIDTLLSKKR